MSIDWEQTFRNWSKPSSENESTKAENAERMIKIAVSNSQILSSKDISVFPQGSYRNNTNVREDSDVDICVCLNSLVSSDYSLVPGMNDRLAGLISASYNYNQFKNDLETALRNKFGLLGVSRGKKAFDVHANSYRIDADVVPAIQGRLYYNHTNFLRGTCVLPDSGGIIYNWPEQNYNNGVAKNNKTNSRFKFIVRAIKRLRNRLAENGYSSAKPISSYLIECLIYVVPDHYFSGDSYKANVNECIKYLYNQIDLNDWTEINEIKYLFRPSQKWSKEQVKEFLSSSWHYIQNPCRKLFIKWLPLMRLDNSTIVPF